MDTFLSGKHAVVTGGSRGIGRAITECLLQAGASVVICSRDQASVDAALTEMRKSTPPSPIFGTAADVGKEEDVKRLFAFAAENVGSPDILVNNAGVGIFRPAGEMSAEQWRQVIDTNLTGTFLCCREAIPRFKAHGGGFIINIGSLAGKNPFASGAAYNASKFGLNGFSEAMMMDHRHDNIRVSTIMPGSVDTGFNDKGKGENWDWKIAPGDIAEIVLSILRMPDRTLISRVEVRPSRPPKK